MGSNWSPEDKMWWRGVGGLVVRMCVRSGEGGEDGTDNGESEKQFGYEKTETYRCVLT